jgi:hypothetical protein
MTMDNRELSDGVNRHKEERHCGGAVQLAVHSMKTPWEAFNLEPMSFGFSIFGVEMPSLIYMSR